MRYRCIISLALFVCVALNVAAQAGELTADDVIRAHEAGVSESTLLSLIQNAGEITPLDSDDDQALEAAGVAEKVRTALANRAGRAADEQTSNPDDPRLAEIVKLVASGLPNDLILGHIRSADPPFAPTVDDLIFLKANGVPDHLIKALFAVPGGAVDATSDTGPAATASPEIDPAVDSTPKAADIDRPEPTGNVLSYGPLLLMTKVGGMFPRNTRGNLLLGDDEIVWQDDDRPDLSASFYASVLKRVSLVCEKGAEGRICHELKLKTVHGDSYRLRDPDWKVGGNAVISAVYDALKTQYPSAKFKVK